MQPVLMIGCGGSGTKAIRHVRDAARHLLLEAGWQGDMPSCWQFIGIDTPSVQEMAFEIPPLPNEDYVSIGSKFSTYRDLYESLEKNWMDDSGASQAKSLVSGWIPDPKETNVPLSKGAGQTRAVGRAAALSSFRASVEPRLRSALRDIRGSSADLDAVARTFGNPVARDQQSTPKPLFVVCTSIGGGTGAGVSLDVIDMARAIDPCASHPILVMFTNDIFDMEAKGALAANSLAFTSEMLAAYWSKPGEITSPLKVSAHSKDTGSGPHAIFAVAREQYGGGSFSTTSELYLAVGEALSTWVTSSKLQGGIINFLEGNWEDYASMHKGSYGFNKDLTGLEDLQDAAISSFGVSKVSVGRSRFDRWAEHKLAWSAMDSLLSGHLRNQSKRPPSFTDEDWAKELGSSLGRNIYDGSGAEGLRGERGQCGIKDAEEYYASNESAQRLIEKARADLRQAVPSAAVPAPNLAANIKQAINRLSNQYVADHSKEDDMRWANAMMHHTLRAASEVAAVTSIPSTVVATETAREMALADAASLEESATGDRRDRDHNREEALGFLESLGDAEVRPGDAAHTRVLEAAALSASYGWRARRREQAGDMLRAFASEVLPQISQELQAAARRIASEIEDEQILKWPKPDEPGISADYLPTAVEFPMEDHAGWIEQLAELCADASNATVDYGGRDIDPVRYRMIAGYKDEISPMLHISGSRKWVIGRHAPVESEAGVEEWQERFRCWADKPGSKYRRHVTEGLNQWLAPEDAATGQRRIDHFDRCERFRYQLTEAKSRSTPMLKLSSSVCRAVHNDIPKVSMFRPQLPFKDGSPGAEIADEVLGKGEWHPVSADMGSVTLTSHFEHPVHPTAVASITEPVANALQAYGSGARRSQSFWQWRRARRLDAFVPVPRATLERMIRGFPIARLCGMVTSATEKPIRIVSLDGRESEFPWPLLARPSRPNDVLAALLESFVIPFGAVESRGIEDAFMSYASLYAIGLANDLKQDNDPLTKAVKRGVAELKGRVDTPKIVGEDPLERRASAEKYLKGQIVYIEECSKHNEIDVRVRGRSGMAEGRVPTGELANVSLDVYRDLLNRVSGGKDGVLSEDDG